jgi:hypothetical protein
MEKQGWKFSFLYLFMCCTSTLQSENCETSQLLYILILLNYLLALGRAYDVKLFRSFFNNYIQTKYTIQIIQIIDKVAFFRVKLHIKNCDRKHSEIKLWLRTVTVTLYRCLEFSCVLRSNARSHVFFLRFLTIMGIFTV